MSESTPIVRAAAPMPAAILSIPGKADEWAAKALGYATVAETKNPSAMATTAAQLAQVYATLALAAAAARGTGPA